MATATPYYRVPVVIFAVLVGGLYVYAKGGGSLLSKRPQVTPATNPQDEALAPPRIEFMMGPKSAPAFDRTPTIQSPSLQQQRVQSAPVQPSQPRTRVLPGSKSMILIDPQTIAPPTNNVQPAPRTRVLPGSKSAILIEPSTIVPPPNNPGNTQQAQPQPSYRQPTYQQPANQRPTSGNQPVQRPSNNSQRGPVSR